MARGNSLFLIAGFLSLLIFSFIVFIFFYMAFFQNVRHAFKDNKEISVSVIINTPSLKMDTPSLKEEEAEDVSIEDLFASVDAKKIDTKLKPNKFNKLNIKSKKIKAKKVESISSKIQSLNSEVVEEKMSNNEGDKYDKYLSEIRNIIYLYFNPGVSSLGFSTKVVIQLSAIGKMLDFRVLTYSSNKELNEESDNMKLRLMGVLFPPNPNGKSGNYIIILIPKG